MRLSFYVSPARILLLSCVAFAVFAAHNAQAESKQHDEEASTETQRILKGQVYRSPFRGLESPDEAFASNDSHSFSLIFGSGFRGSRSEGPTLDESFGTEFGVGMPYLLGLDWSLGLGRLLERGAHIQIETTGRAFLFAVNSGPYLGLGSTLTSFSESGLKGSKIFATFGLFGGEGLYLEWDFRESAIRPLAAVTELGFRFRLGTRKPAPDDTKGPLVRVPTAISSQSRVASSPGQKTHSRQ